MARIPKHEHLIATLKAPLPSGHWYWCVICQMPINFLIGKSAPRALTLEEIDTVFVLGKLRAAAVYDGLPLAAALATLSADEGAVVERALNPVFSASVGLGVLDGCRTVDNINHAT